MNTDARVTLILIPKVAQECDFLKNKGFVSLFKGCVRGGALTFRGGGTPTCFIFKNIVCSCLRVWHGIVLISYFETQNKLNT